MEFVASSSSSSSSSSASSSSTQPQRTVPWVEKYRPSSVNDVSHQDEVIKTLKMSIEQGNLPHLLFHGPPGTGKTTTILALARALYGPEMYRSRILELNASDDRGISVVREKIKTFAQASVGGAKTPGYPCPRFKLIILDEADTMTPEAQSALRRVMETYSKVTRFCLICNYVTRLIEPLASRCAKFRFKPLPAHAMRDRMLFIQSSEGVTTSDEVLQTILECANGDMRRAVTLLQSCKQLCALNPKGISREVVVDVAGKIPDRVMERMWEAVSKNTQFDAIDHVVRDVVAEGFSLGAIIVQLHEMIVAKETVSDINKALISEKIAQVDQCLIDGANEHLQLLDLLAFMNRRLQGHFGDDAFASGPTAMH